MPNRRERKLTSELFICPQLVGSTDFRRMSWHAGTRSRNHRCLPGPKSRGITRLLQDKISEMISRITAQCAASIPSLSPMCGVDSKPTPNVRRRFQVLAQCAASLSSSSTTVGRRFHAASMGCDGHGRISAKQKPRQFALLTLRNTVQREPVSMSRMPQRCALRILSNVGEHAQLEPPQGDRRRQA